MHPVSVFTLVHALVLVIAATLGGPGGAQDMASDDLGDPHLSIIPRSAADRALVAERTRPPQDFSRPELFEAQPGGAATVAALATPDAFSLPSGNIGFDRELAFRDGNGLFRKIWVAAPARTTGSDGLGPLYNARSCQLCHLKDGRGHPPDAATKSPGSLFLRVAIPGPVGEGGTGIAGYSATLPDPVYGTQMQDLAAPGQTPEYRLTIRHDETAVPLAGGAVAVLRHPTYSADALGYGALHPQAMLSPRVAPPMIGLGLLEAVPAADILALADPDDADGDGISGRPNIVLSREFARPILGRFGLKAGTATLRAQAAAALSADMGLSSRLAPAAWGDCTAAQLRCRTAPDGTTQTGAPGTGAPEVPDDALDLLAFYSRNLGVPARRAVDDPQVLQGKSMFHQVGCPACHHPKFVTHRLADQPEQSFQLIWPYTDLLLHDMGEALADHSPEARASGREWRTAPLWGIGLTQIVDLRAKFLHDGRARTLLEAILWHGGEAAAARALVVALPPADRAALIRFLESL